MKFFVNIKKYYWLFIAAALLVIAAVFYFSFSVRHDLEVDFLAVGQGDAALIKAPGGQNILIDGGPDSTVLRELAKVLPFWDRQIDLLILTHPHSDHAAGLIEVLKNYDVRQIATDRAISSEPAYLAWVKSAQAAKAPWHLIEGDQEIVFANLKLTLAPGLIGAANDESLVVKLNYGQTNFLFMGDAGAATEEKLLTEKFFTPIDVLKVGHHGSDTASSDEFIKAVQPRYAVIEVGKNNYGLPSLRTIRRLERIGAMVLRTDQGGMKKFISDGISTKVQGPMTK